MQKHKRTTKAIVWLLTLAMAFSLVPVLGGEAAMAAHPEDLFRTAAYTAADGNIARGVVPTSRRTNGGARNTVTNGTLNTNPVHNTWGIGSGAANDASNWVLTFDQPYMITAMRVMWDIYTDAGVRWPLSATVRYNPGATQAAGNDATSDSVGASWIIAGTPVNVIQAVPAGTNVGIDGNSGGGTNRIWPAPSTKANNTRWNVVVFDPPITTTQLQLRAIRNSSGGDPGVGLQQWEVFGEIPVYDPEVVVARALQDLNIPASATSNLTLPATGFQGAAITWASSNADVISAAGVVTRPAWDTADATVTLTATATYEEESGTREFIVTVPKMPSPQDILNSDLAAINLGNLVNRITNITLPATGAQGTAFAWASSNPDVVSTAGVVTRPAHFEEDANVTLTVTGTREGAEGIREFQVSVPKMPTPQQLVDEAVAALTVANTNPANANLVLPATGLNGTTITWASSNTAYLWANGTVLRPPQGSPNATAVLTATVSYDTASSTKTFNVTIPAYPAGGKSIVGYDPINVVQPRGLMLAKLPNFVNVYYSDGTQGMRQIVWTRFSVANQTSDFGNTANYTIPGNIMGDTSSNEGYRVVANITVTAAGAAAQAVYNNVPSVVPKASPLHWQDVTINNDSNGSANRLVTNRNGSIAYTVGQNVTAYCYNFRDSAGLTVSGYGSPSGWNARTEKLKGHGDGHYMSALALAYASGGGTTAQNTTLLQNMERMTREARNAQSLTYVPFTGTQIVNSYAGNPHNGQLETNVSNGWREAKDRYRTPAETDALRSPQFFFNSADTHRFGGTNAGVTYYNPATFGAGYMHSIIPESLILNECYAGYAGGWTSYGIWAPYYSVHKVLQGLIDIHDVLNGMEGSFTTSTGGPNRVATRTYQEVADEALMVAKEMGLWIWNRLEYRSRPGNRSANNQPGFRNTMWGPYIAGESGGTIECLARLSLILKERGDFIPLTVDNKQQDVGASASAKLATAASYFENNHSESASGNLPHMEALSQNRDSMRTLHANSHVPNAVGALWTYRATGDPKWYRIAENYLDYTIGRYSYTPGGVTGGSGSSNYELYPGAYGMTAGLVQGAARTDKIMETCATHNNIKLARDIYAHNPDDGQYMDYIEKSLYSQIIGSIEAGTTNNSTTYGFHIGINSTTGTNYNGTPPTSGSNVGSTCCTGTGSENHLRYSDCAYYESVDKNTLYVNLYMPTTVQWQGYTIRQACIWPSEQSTFTFTPGTDAGAREIKFRVPAWATEAFDVRLNGVSLLTDGVKRGTYVSTGSRVWAASDTIVVTMPFDLGVHYSPTKRTSAASGHWFGTIQWGPLLMAGEGITGTSYTATGQIITLDSRFSTGAGTNVQVLSRSRLPATEGRQTNNIPRLTINVSGTNRTFSPLFWFLGGGSRTTYFDIAISDGGAVADRVELYAKLMEAADLLDGSFTEESLAALQAAINAAVTAYQNNSATTAQLDNQILALDNAIAALEDEGAANVTKLVAAIALAEEKAESEFTWDSWAALQVALANGYTILGEAQDDPPTAGQILVNQATNELNIALAGLAHISSLNWKALEEALEEAALRTNPPHDFDPDRVDENGMWYYLDETGDPVEDWEEHEYQIFTRRSWNRFLSALRVAENIYEMTQRIPSQQEIDNAAGTLAGWAGQDAFLCDEYESFDAKYDAVDIGGGEYTILAAFRAGLDEPYSESSLLRLDEAILSAQNMRQQSTSAAFTWRNAMARELDAALAFLHVCDFEEVTTATCLEPGIGTFTCTFCGEFYTMQQGPLGHSYTKPIAGSATTSRTNLQDKTNADIGFKVKCERCDDFITVTQKNLKLKQNGTQKFDIEGYDVVIVVNGNNMLTSIAVNGAVTTFGSSGGSGGNQNSQK